MCCAAMFWGGVGVSAISAAFGDMKTLAGSAIVGLLTPPLLWALSRRYARFAMTSAVALLLAVVVIEVAISDGIHDVAVNLCAVIVLISALLLDRRAAIVLTVLTVVSVAVPPTACSTISPRTSCWSSTSRT